jgi:hypothetical protein
MPFLNLNGVDNARREENAARLGPVARLRHGSSRRLLPHPEQHPPSSIAYDTIGLLSAAAIVYGVRRNRPSRPGIWYLSGRRRAAASDDRAAVHQSRARSTSYRLLCTALSLLLSADIAYAAVNMISSYDGGVMDAGWLMSYALWGTAALHPSMRALSEVAPERAGRFTRRRLALLATTSLLAPAILAEQGFSHPGHVDWQAICVGAVVLFLLVLTRMSGLVSQVPVGATPKS